MNRSKKPVNNLVLGITGTNAAGKDSVADFFKDLDFNIYSHSDELRSILRKKNIKITRDSLAIEGNKLRKKSGNGALSEIIIKKINLPAAILSIRHFDEVKVYKNNLKNFVLLSVDAPRKIRYKRAVERAREGEGKTQSFEEFVDKEEKEMWGKEEVQQIGRVMEMADVKIINDGTFKDLRKKLEILYNKLT